MSNTDTTTVQPTRSNALTWIPRLVAAGILAMTLPYKFAGAEETVRLFEALGAGDAGRIGTGVMEAIAVVLLLVPRTAALGGLLTVGLMSGAILSHLTVLGIFWDGDASLFTFAVVAFLTGGLTAFSLRRTLPIVGARFQPAEV
ncbi:MAG: DoxX family protein [Planctomycetota bacterium]